MFTFFKKNLKKLNYDDNLLILQKENLFKVKFYTLRMEGKKF